MRVRVRPNRHYPRGLKHKASSYRIYNRDQRKALAFTEKPETALS